ncbi:MAG: PilN domain-containing protein, partial [Patescibacteria group bacterium]
SPHLKDVVGALPPEARLEILSLGNDELTVRGVSNSRTAVLDMERALKALPWVERVDAPLQNFAAGGKGEFSFTLRRKVDQNG